MDRHVDRFFRRAVPRGKAGRRTTNLLPRSSKRSTWAKISKIAGMNSAVMPMSLSTRVSSASSTLCSIAIRTSME